LVLLAVLALVVYLFRHPLMRLAASALVAEDPGPRPTTALLFSGDRRLDVAGVAFKDGQIKQVLLLKPPPNRLERLGVVTTRYDKAHQELLKRGVPAERIAALPGLYRDAWEVGDQVQAWLEQHPGEELLIYCERFASRKLSMILDRTLGGDRHRVRLAALPHREYDETNWWQSKLGALEFLYNSLTLAHVGLVGRPASPPTEPDAAAYEEALK
jgi:hypothetical protein